MLAIKIIAAAVILFSVVSRSVMDFFWKDKRTRRYRYARNSFIVAAIVAAVLNVIVLAVDEVRKERVSREEKAHRTEFEDQALGGVSPTIWFGYYKDNKLLCPRADKVFPGDSFSLQMWSQTGMGPGPVFALLVHNPNSFPIYDISVMLLYESPNLDNSKSLTQDFHSDKTFPILHPNEDRVTLYDAPPDLMSKALKFSVKTKRGMTDHSIAMALVTNQWEYASSVVDWNHSKVVYSYRSEHFPLDSNGNPQIQIFTRTEVTNSNPPAAQPSKIRL